MKNKLMIILLMILVSCGQKLEHDVQIDGVPENIDLTFKIDPEAMEQLKIICENISDTSQEEVDCIDQLVQGYIRAVGEVNE